MFLVSIIILNNLTRRVGMHSYLLCLNSPALSIGMNLKVFSSFTRRTGFKSLLNDLEDIMILGDLTTQIFADILKYYSIKLSGSCILLTFQ